jgi:cytochrome c oxidase subunit 4
MADAENTTTQETGAGDGPVIRIHDDVTDFRRPMVEAGGHGSLSAAAVEAEAHDMMHHKEYLSDEVNLFGLQFSVPGGIYTVVFGGLAVATIIEVIIFELPRGFLTIPLMLALALMKAVLVVLYYMHLRTDSRIFAFTLLIPLGVALAATFYLLAVPPTGY